jgi:hypothetical protein
MSDLKMTNAGDYMTEYGEKFLDYPDLSSTNDFPKSVAISLPKPAGAWDLGKFHIQVFRRPTDEQIKNTEEMFGWKWMDYENK